MLIRDNDDATIEACYTMKEQLQDTVFNTWQMLACSENYLKFYSGIIQ